MQTLGARLFRIGWFLTPLGATIAIAGLTWAVVTQPAGTHDAVLLDLAERVWMIGIWISIGSFLLALSGSTFADSSDSRHVGGDSRVLSPRLPRLDGEACAAVGAGHGALTSYVETDQSGQARTAAAG